MHSCPHSLTLILLLRLSLADALRIDDRDPAIQYNGPWSYGTEIHDNASLNWDGTLRYSNISGATATLRFTGTSISVFGSFHPPGRYSMQSQYSVDGQQPFTFIPLQEVPASIHQTLFYSSPRFPHGEHTLVVTNLGEQLFLDFFDVQDETVPPSISTTPATSITSPTVPSQTSTSSAEGNRTTTVPSNAPTQPLASDPSATSDSQKPNVASEFTFVTETSLAAATTAPPSESLPLTAGTTRASASTPAGNSTIAPVGAAQSPTQRSPRGISKGAIAGIAVGSLIIIAVLGAGLWWYWRSRERTWLVTDLHFEPEKMSVPDPNFRGHRPTLPGLTSSTKDAYGDHRASVHRRSAGTPSSSVHLIGYGSTTPSTCSG